ncbi:MAG: FtsQ-type POTRA domain-containing protein [Eggerthellaceae bacterium]|nr:FtsQ-type POTRA domain-containing protein [Eggerthellaceae bacterium]
MPQVNPRSKQATSAAPHITSVRVGDLRGASPTMRSNQPRLARFIISLVLIAAIIGGGVYLYASDLLSIDEIRVSGVHHLTSEEIARLAAVPASSTLLRIDTDAIKERLEENSWVESAEVNRIFPHTLELAVTERAISAVVEVTNVEKQEMESWAVSKDGMWLMYIPPEDSEEAESLSEQVYEDARYVLHITEVPLGIQPEAGTFCTDSSVLNALSIVSGFTTSLADQVAVVSATDTANTILTLDNGIQIAFGTADDIRDKERVCLKLMEEYPDQIAYINVRVVDKPTWRAIGAW